MEAEIFSLSQLKILNLISATKLRNTAQDFLYKISHLLKIEGLLLGEQSLPKIDLPSFPSFSKPKLVSLDQLIIRKSYLKTLETSAKKLRKNR